MALRVKHLGKFGAHATALKAGLQQGDVLISYDGRTDFEREADIFFHVVTQHKIGDKVAIKVRRESQTKEFTIPLQE